MEKKVQNIMGASVELDKLSNYLLHACGKLKNDIGKLGNCYKKCLSLPPQVPMPPREH